MNFSNTALGKGLTNKSHLRSSCVTAAAVCDIKYRIMSQYLEQKVNYLSNGELEFFIWAPMSSNS